MNSHTLQILDRSHGGALVHLAIGQALRLGRAGGELSVVSGSIWLTRDGDPDDHVIERGGRMRVRGTDRAVVEALHPGATATVRWQPRPQALAAVLFAAPLRALAALAERAAAGFAALARIAAASARRAQGCIAGADSIASSGALK